MDSESAEELPVQRLPNLLHFFAFLALLFALLFAAELVLLFAFRQPISVLSDQKLQLIVTAAVYLLTLAAAGLLFPAFWHQTFRSGIRWNGPAARPWLGLFGLVLGFVAEATDRFLPTPHDMPIEDVFKTPGIIWLLTIFGTVLAPLFEEVVFRGLLLPAVAHAIDWLRLPSAHTGASDLAHAEWRVSDRLSTGALIASSLLTSVLFAGIHAPQLGYNWAPVALLVCVSCVLCAVRIRTNSVAASTLVHGCYNLAAFLLIFVSTSGFRHMDAP